MKLKQIISIFLMTCITLCSQTMVSPVFAEEESSSGVLEIVLPYTDTDDNIREYADPNGSGLIFGYNNYDRWQRITTGERQRGGKKCRATLSLCRNNGSNHGRTDYYNNDCSHTRQASKMCFKVDNSKMAASQRIVGIEFDYYDDPVFYDSSYNRYNDDYRWIEFKYLAYDNGETPTINVKYIPLTGSGEWRTASFTLYDAQFDHTDLGSTINNNRGFEGGYDFCIGMGGVLGGFASTYCRVLPGKIADPYIELPYKDADTDNPQYAEPGTGLFMAFNNYDRWKRYRTGERTRGGKKCRATLSLCREGSNLHTCDYYDWNCSSKLASKMCFKVDNAIVPSTQRVINVEFDYYDDPEFISNNVFDGYRIIEFKYLAYNGGGSPKVATKTIPVVGDGQWKTAKLTLTDAQFDQDGTNIVSNDGFETGYDICIGMSGNRGGFASTYLKFDLPKYQYTIDTLAFETANGDTSSVPAANGKVKSMYVTKYSTDTADNAYGIVAAYKDNQVIAVSTPIPVTESGELSVNMTLPNVEDMYATAFVWNLETYNALAACYSTKLQNN